MLLRDQANAEDLIWQTDDFEKSVLISIFQMQKVEERVTLLILKKLSRVLITSAQVIDHKAAPTQNAENVCQPDFSVLIKIGVTLFQKEQMTEYFIGS